jgi:SSS family solute:Na+ symporter
VASTVYVFFGGFRSVVQTDKFQFILMYSGFALILLFAISNYGGFKFLHDRLPPSHFTWHGGNSVQYIFVWFFLASWTFIDPGFHQRCAAAKSHKVARNGILLSVISWFVFDCLTVTSGLYAAAVLKDIDPILSYPLLIERLLPPFIKGLVLTAFLAVIMSTIDSYSFLSAITFGRDLLWRIKKTDESNINSYTRSGLILTGIISILLCLAFPSVIKLWYVIGTLFIPPMLLPLLTAYFPIHKLPPKYTLFIMITSFVLSLSLFIYGQFNFNDGHPLYFLGIEPFFPGFLLSIVLYIFAKINLRKSSI